MSDPQPPTDQSGEQQKPSQEPFVVAPRQEQVTPSGLPMAGGTELSAYAARVMRERRVANPDDPVVAHPLHGVGGVLSGPDQPNMPGRIAIVQGQIYIVGLVLIAQLVLVTLALYELLSGRPETLWGIAAASLVGFIVALVVALWPRTR